MNQGTMNYFSPISGTARMSRGSRYTTIARPVDYIVDLPAPYRHQQHQ